MAHSDPMPRDPQGAETRAETRTEWRNVYRTRLDRTLTSPEYESREVADAMADREADYGFCRIAVEEVTTVTTITRHPIPPHAGEETKG